MTLLRSLLFVPGNKASMLDKAAGLAPDAFVPDMEDSVPSAEKANARTTIASFLSRLQSTGKPVIPRVNALESGLLEDDLAAVVGHAIFGVSVGKIRTAADVDEIASLLETLERRAGVTPGRTRLVPWIETAEAIADCDAICSASPRIVGVAFGAEDYTFDMGIERLADDTQLLYARSRLCVAARAAQVAALDTPYFKLGDLDGLGGEAERAKALGFKGKFAIHPEQIAALNAAFAPSAREIEHARRVVAAFEEAEKNGRGSTSLDGWVVDVPVVKRARAVLELAERSAATGGCSR
jgi:citrate lyase subunit beta/citryl-CoA lyase